MEDPCFIHFNNPIDHLAIPTKLNDPFDTNIPEIGRLASAELQEYLLSVQPKWNHNFGLTTGKVGPIRAKMFGVLVVKNAQGIIAYLAAYSGKLTEQEHPAKFVPSMFDISVNDSSFSKGMTGLTHLGNQIKKLEKNQDESSAQEIKQLKEKRKSNSLALQKEMLKQYHFLNSAGQSRSIYEIFEAYNGKLPPGGSGDCAAPKLFQYAFEHDYIPLAVAEFWWGNKKTVIDKQHKSFYPACNDKCLPILAYMLES